MRGLLPLTLLLALTATAGIALLATRAPRTAAAREPLSPAPPPDGPAGEEPAADGIRPYETTATLVEDLRDALTGEDRELARECHRVSAALARQARWTLVNLVRREASPRVRALLVLAAGVHLPDDALLLESLHDRDPLVREAAALAAGHRADGVSASLLLGRVPVVLGRAMAAETRDAIQRALAREQDQGARGTLRSVLGASPP